LSVMASENKSKLKNVLLWSQKIQTLEAIIQQINSCVHDHCVVRNVRQT
jgi:hypothetical protein